MHPVIATSIATELDHYAEVVRREWTWPSPTAGFASWLFSRHGLPAFFTHPDITPPVGLEDGRINEAPVLAAYGYLLAMTDEPDQDLVEAWTAAATRLSARDPLPGDRASFFFRPIELLGLALGAVAVAEHDPKPRQWLRQVLHDGASRLGTDPRSAALAACTATILGASAGTVRIGPSSHTSTIDLAFLWLAALLTPGAACATSLDKSTDELESQLLYRITQGREANTDAAEAAVVYAAVTNAVRTGLARADYGSPAALRTVEDVMRRFPATVRELAKRHNDRPSLVDIKDEYDVQDVLRGILSSLFDDVRDEETAPSHAGLRSRMDLLLKREQIVIETKMTRANLGQRKVAEELAIDKELYRSHPDCKTLVCFVYDPTHRLTNPTALESDLTDHEDQLPTVVIVAPRA
jgi:DpnII restriction endonuclease